MSASVATSASGRGISIPFGLGVPAEGAHHGVAVDLEGREAQPQLALRKVRAVLGADPGRGVRMELLSYGHSPFASVAGWLAAVR